MNFKLLFNYCFKIDQEFKDFCYSNGFIESEYKENMIKYYDTKEKQAEILNKFLKRNEVKR